jgi:hypothetical protein
VRIREEMSRFSYIGGAIVRSDLLLAYPAAAFDRLRGEEPGSDACITHAILAGSGEAVLAARGVGRRFVTLRHTGLTTWVRAAVLAAFDGEERPAATPLALTPSFVSRGGTETVLDAPGDILLVPFEAPLEVLVSGLLAVIGSFEAHLLSADARTPTPRATVRLSGSGVAVLCPKLR